MQRDTHIATSIRWPATISCYNLQHQANSQWGRAALSGSKASAHPRFQQPGFGKAISTIQWWFLSITAFSLACPMGCGYAASCQIYSHALHVPPIPLPPSQNTSHPFRRILGRQLGSQAGKEPSQWRSGRIKELIQTLTCTSHTIKNSNSSPSKLAEIIKRLLNAWGPMKIGLSVIAIFRNNNWTAIISIL